MSSYLLRTSYLARNDISVVCHPFLTCFSLRDCFLFPKIKLQSRSRCSETVVLENTQNLVTDQLKALIVEKRCFNQEWCLATVQGKILRRIFLLCNAIDGRLEGTARLGRRRIQLLDDLKEKGELKRKPTTGQDGKWNSQQINPGDLPSFWINNNNYYYYIQGQYSCLLDG